MKKRVFSGACPTARQHIGNLLGAIDNYVKLQQEYDAIYCIVDIHSLTTLQDTHKIQGYINDLALDWLAAGLDPQKSIIFVQSHVPEVTELQTYLGMLTPLSWLLRVPTFKEKAKAQPDNINYGLVGYPVLMTADIVLYKAEVIPVGEDQLPHIELAREIVRRFNTQFGETFPEPIGKLTSFPSIPSATGKGKMSKSEEGSTNRYRPYRRRKLPPGLYRRHRPGPVNSGKTRGIRKSAISTPCTNISRLPRSSKTSASNAGKPGIGCVDCKKLLAKNMNQALRQSGPDARIGRQTGLCQRSAG